MYKACFRPRKHSTGLPSLPGTQMPGSFSSGLTSYHQHHAGWGIIGQVTPLALPRLASLTPSRKPAGTERTGV